MSKSPFQQIISILLPRLRPIIAVSVLIATLAGLSGLAISPRYTAKAEIVIEPHPSIPIAGQPVPAEPPEDESTFQTYVAGLASRDHLQRVLDSLSRDGEFRSTLQPQAMLRGRLVDAWHTLVTWLQARWFTATRPALDFLSQLSTVEGPSDPSPAASAQEPSLEAFERQILVYQERGSHVLAVTFTSTSAEQAALTANRVAQFYVEREYEQKREKMNRAVAWIGRRIPELRGELENAEVAVQGYRIDHKLVQTNQTDLVDQKLADLNRQLTAAESSLTERLARLESIRELRRGGSKLDALAQTLDTPNLRDIRHQELALVQSHLEDEAKIAGAQVRALQERLAMVQQASSESRNAEVRLREMERESATLRQLYESLLQRREQLNEQKEMVTPDVRILSLAAPPDRPSSPSPLMFVPPALIASLMGGALLAVAVEQLDRGLRSAREVNEVLGIPCIALVPQIRLRRKTRPHLQLRAKPFAAYSEAIRSLVAALQLGGPRDAAQMVLICSSVPREGKTTLAASFAVYTALLGRRVVLVDLDFRRPAILSEIGGKADTGVLDLLDLDSLSPLAIQSVPGLGLDWLPVRRLPDDPLAPFATGQLQRLLQRLRKSYDCIVIDSPPLLAVSEGRLLASLADKILFVVKWASTRRDVAQNALELLRNARPLCENGRDVVWTVLTQIDLKKHARYRYGDAGETFVRYPQYFRLDGPAGAGRKPSKTAAQQGGSE